MIIFDELINSVNHLREEGETDLRTVRELLYAAKNKASDAFVAEALPEDWPNKRHESGVYDG